MQKNTLFFWIIRRYVIIEFAKPLHFLCKRAKKAFLRAAWCHLTPFFIWFPLLQRLAVRCWTKFSMTLLKTKGQQCSTTVILNLFQDLSAERDSKGSRWDVEPNSAWRYEGQRPTMLHHRHPELVSGSVSGQTLMRLAVRCWNLRLSENRDKLARTMPSVSKLNYAKQISGWRW